MCEELHSDFSAEGLNSDLRTEPKEVGEQLVFGRQVALREGIARNRTTPPE